MILAFGMSSAKRCFGHSTPFLDHVFVLWPRRPWTKTMLVDQISRDVSKLENRLRSSLDCNRSRTL